MAASKTLGSYVQNNELLKFCYFDKKFTENQKLTNKSYIQGFTKRS